MERLTERTKSGKLYLTSEPETDIYGNLTEKGFAQLDEIYDRLAAYEDIGLSPDEITKLFESYKKSNMEQAEENYKLEQEIPHWIPVSEKLPKHGGTFIICTTQSDVFTAEFWIERNEFTRRNGTSFVSPVRYWQELPNAPKEEI